MYLQTNRNDTQLPQGYSLMKLKLTIMNYAFMPQEGFMLNELLIEIRKFNRERDWDQYHSPKNLATSILIEAAELAEVFQWLTEEESWKPGGKALKDAEDEVADVFIYLLNLADKLGIDPVKAARQKLVKNAEKYPTDTARGSRLKYTELGEGR
jgi:dCTP diphosphatase